MEEWKEYMIGDICRIKHGFAFKGIHFVDEPQKYVCVTPGNFALKGGFKNDKPKYYNGPIPKDYVLHKDDLVVTMTDLSKNGDTLGYSALIPEDDNYIFLHNQRIGLIEDISQEIDKHFLYWVMRTYDYQRYIVGHCSGSTVKHTSPSGIGSYFFKCPDIKKQKNISSILDNIDGKIEVNRRINENLEQLAQALFKSWFVDFEPFKDGEFVESELGMIPKGWRVGKLGDFVQTTSGGTPSRNIDNYYRNGTINWVKSKELMNNFIYDTEELITENAIKNSSAKLIPKHSVLIAMYGATVGKFGILVKQMACNQAVCALLPNSQVPFSILYMFAYHNKEVFQNKAIGSAQQNISQIIIKNTDFIFNSEAFIRYHKIVEPLFYTIEINSIESRRLAELRDTLLPRLMSGKLKVNEIENSL